MRAAMLCAQTAARRQRAGAPLAQGWRLAAPATTAALRATALGLPEFARLGAAANAGASRGLSSLGGGDAGEAPAAAKALPEWKARVISKTREAVAARRAAEEARIAESRTSVVEHPVVLPFRDPAAPSKFAVVALSGTQYKVVEDDLIVCNLIEGAEVGKEYVIDEVLLVGGLDKTVIGRPVIKGATVTAVVEEITRDKKILIMKRRTKNHKSRRTKGFRRDVTFLRISSIDYDLKQI